ncbi:hypothetical protein JCM10212_000456 [Sporobolomyces blumeae]
MALLNPRSLFDHSVLGATVLILSTLTFTIDFVCVVLRGWWYGYVTTFQLDDSLGLDGLSFGIVCSILWHTMTILLLVDVIAAILIPSRDLQRGAVTAFGIVSMMQVPIVALFLMYELSPTNQLWLYIAW